MTAITPHGGPSPLAAAHLVGFIATANLPAARRFYVETLGLSVVSESDFACALDANGSTLRLTPVDGFVAPAHTVAGWSVANIVASVTELAARGVTFQRYPGMPQDDHGIWTTPAGDRVAWVLDPDANVLSLTQHRTPRGRVAGGI